MRKLLLLLSVLLLSFSWAAAQDMPSQTYPSQDQTTKGQPEASQSGQTSSRTAGGETTVLGCLSNSNGNYMLTDKNGNMYQIMGDNSKLSEHVGHEIKVTGTVSAASGSQTGESGGGMGQSGGSAQQALQVSSVKHISKTCQNGGGMAH